MFKTLKNIYKETHTEFNLYTITISFRAMGNFGKLDFKTSF